MFDPSRRSIRKVTIQMTIVRIGLAALTGLCALIAIAAAALEKGQEKGQENSRSGPSQTLTHCRTTRMAGSCGTAATSF